MTAGISTAGVAAANGAGESGPNESGGIFARGLPGQLPRRLYGPDGVGISVIGLGGIVVLNEDQTTANRVVAEAVERGVNYFDVAPGYGDAEIKLGPALQPYRKRAFLACKTVRRDRQGAEKELNQSLHRLKTETLDLYQLHGITDVKKDVDVAFAKDGAMEVFKEAKASGRVRHLGFSAHSEEAALAAMDRYDFDSMLIPINFACLITGGFGGRAIETARKKGLTILALKAMARQQWPEDDAERDRYGKCWYQPLTDRRMASLALRWTLSRPVTAALPPGDKSLFRMALDIAMDLQPLDASEESELQVVAKSLRPIFAV